MKHALRIFAAGAALLAVACTKEQSDGERIPESFPSDSHYVNVDEARAAVETMLGSMDPETRGGAVRSITGVVTIGRARRYAGRRFGFARLPRFQSR